MIRLYVVQEFRRLQFTGAFVLTVETKKHGVIKAVQSGKKWIFSGRHSMSKEDRKEFDACMNYTLEQLHELIATLKRCKDCSDLLHDGICITCNKTEDEND